MPAFGKPSLTKVPTMVLPVMTFRELPEVPAHTVMPTFELLPRMISLFLTTESTESVRLIPANPISPSMKLSEIRPFRKLPL